MDVLNNFPTDPKTGLFQEQADRIPGDIFHSGRQLDNAGDITHCMFVSAACVFMMISEFLPDVGIEIIAGNNQFYKNFVNSKGKRLDNNHVRGRGINFVVKGIDKEKVRIPEVDRCRRNATKIIIDNTTIQQSLVYNQ